MSFGEGTGWAFSIPHRGQACVNNVLGLVDKKNPEIVFFSLVFFCLESSDDGRIVFSLPSFSKP